MVDLDLFLRNFSELTKRRAYGAEKNENFRGDRGPSSEYLLSVDFNGMYREVARTVRNCPAGAAITNITRLIHSRLFDRMIKN